jgi:hypothetical protein
VLKPRTLLFDGPLSLADLYIVPKNKSVAINRQLLNCRIWNLTPLSSYLAGSGANYLVVTHSFPASLAFDVSGLDK